MRSKRIKPSMARFVLKLPDVSPVFPTRSTRHRKKALLTKVRDNRLVDLFLHVAAYPLPDSFQATLENSRLRITRAFYFAIDIHGKQFVIPVQAKGGSDQIGVVQVMQDLALCRKSFPKLTPRPVAVQFVHDEAGEVIVMFELAISDDEVRIVDEKHYRLVPANQISAEDLAIARRSQSDVNLG